MYNRYIPQADGSYRRSRVADPAPKPHPVSPPPAADCQEVSPPDPPCTEEPPTHQSHCRGCCKKLQPHKNEPRTAPPNSSIGTFLRQLMPKNFDTGDLLVVILLLLMSCDCPDDQNTALLTLALYLFM